MTAKNRSIIIILSVSAAIIILAICFVSGIGMKMIEERDIEYTTYDFDGENIIQYCQQVEYYNENGLYRSIYGYDLNETSYDASCIITLSSDGTLTKQVAITEYEEEELGNPPNITKKLSSQQLEEVKNQIKQSYIKKYIEENESSHIYGTVQLHRA